MRFQSQSSGSRVFQHACLVIFSFASLVVVPYCTSQTADAVVDAATCKTAAPPSWCSGTTADAWITSAFAVLGGSGTVDARGFGNSTQTFNSTVSCGTASDSVHQTLIFDPATSIKPSTAGMTLFNVHRNCTMIGAHVSLPSGMTFSGSVFSVTDNVREPDMLRISDWFIDASAETNYDNSAGYGVYLSGSDTSTQSIAFASFTHGRCLGLRRCIYATNTGTGWVNGNFFSDIVGTYSGAVIELNGSSTTSGAAISGNMFSGLQGEGCALVISLPSPGPCIMFTGSGQTWDNQFTLKLWDVATGIFEHKF